jgi:large subunit ribosomal protein L18
MAMDKTDSRLRRKQRIRKRVSGSPDRPRLTVFRSNKHIYAQVVDDMSHRSLAAASSLDKVLADAAQGQDKRGTAKTIGIAIAKACLDKGIKAVVFDRNGYAYHGRVKELADGAREGGLEL